jgi:hypothetical protein
MDTALSVDSLTVRLADEGVPLRAIARATSIPSHDLREHLLDAQADGRLLELPHDDWPPGFPRDQRSLQITRLSVENRSALLLAVRQIFHLTRSQAQLLLALIQNTELARGRLDMGKIVDVHICHMRPLLQAFGISIETLWGYGYQLSADNRRRAMDLILQRVAIAPCL